MIRVIVERDGTAIKAVQAHGHAGYAAKGTDIVCAAVSTLLTTCVNSLECVCGVAPEMLENTEGALSFRLPEGLTDQQVHDTQLLLRSLIQGLRDVQGAAPRHLRLSIEERRNSPC